MTTADPEQVVAVARDWLGTPYLHQASMRGAGADCLGLARGVWREVVGAEPHPAPPYSRDWGEIGAREVLASAAAAWMIPLHPEQREPGDLILFRMRRGAPAKHCGILTAPERFIHSYERLGVVEEWLSEFWRRRIAFAFRYPKGDG